MFPWGGGRTVEVLAVILCEIVTRDGRGVIVEGRRKYKCSDASLMFLKELINDRLYCYGVKGQEEGLPGFFFFFSGRGFEIRFFFFSERRFTVIFLH